MVSKKLIQLFGYKSLLSTVVLSAAISATANPSNLDQGVFDGFKDCALTFRYDEAKKKFDPPLSGFSPSKNLVTVMDGYATIHVRAIYHGLRINQVVVPTTTTTLLLYRVRIKAQPTRVRRTLQRTWDIRFAESGPDGMDNKVKSVFKILDGTAQVRVFADSEKSTTTILECNQ